MYRIDLRDLEHMADPATDQWLLPPQLRSCSDPKRQLLYKEALLLAMEEYLTNEQSEALHKRYWLQKSVTEIGVEMGITTSAASKRIATAMRILKDRIGFCIKLYETLSRKEYTGNTQKILCGK